MSAQQLVRLRDEITGFAAPRLICIYAQLSIESLFLMSVPETIRHQLEEASKRAMHDLLGV